MSKPKVCIVHGSNDYARMFTSRGWEVVDSIIKADIVQFTGGSDVDPSYYGQSTHPTTFSNKARDQSERQVYKACLNLKKPMVGICRGGQFLNVMCGGSMFQDVNNHTREHEAVDVETGVTTRVSSTHHQMMNPSQNGKVLLVAHEATQVAYCDDRGTIINKAVDQLYNDTEAVLYVVDGVPVLCFQPHPEFNGVKECQDLYFGYIDKHVYKAL